MNRIDFLLNPVLLRIETRGDKNIYKKKELHI